MTPQLKTKLASWVEHGLISADQAENIALHEAREPERPWVLYGIAGIGVTALVTGVISLVAANWDEISALVKLSCYFLVQGFVGFAFFRTAKKPGLVRETLLTLFVPLFLAGIGLVAQIYNLHGDGWQALLLWVTITLPAVWLANSWAVVHLWTAAVLLTSLIWAEADRQTALPEFGRVCVAAALPLMLVALGYFGEKYRAVSTYLRTALVNWGLGVTLVAGTLIGNVLWHAWMYDIQEHLIYVLLPWSVLVVACSAIWFRPAVKRELRSSLVGMVLSTGLFLTFPLFHTDSSASHAEALFGATGFFVTWVLAASAAAHAQYKRLFDLASLVIAVRVVVVYFEVFGSLAMTGVGLIVSGAVILAIAFAWHRFRKQVRQQLGGGS